MKKLIIIFLSLLCFSSWGQSGIIPLAYQFGYEIDTGSTPPVDTSYSPEFQAVYDYAVLQGYTVPSWQQRRVLDTLAREAVADGWWDEYDVIYVGAHNGGVDFANINWKNPNLFYAHDSSQIFVTDTGWQSNGSSNAHTNTTFTPSTDGVNYLASDASASIYIRTNRPASGNLDFGNIDLSSGRLFFRSFRDPTNKYEGQINGSGTTINGGTSDSVAAFYTVSRSGTSITIYRNGSSSYTVSGTAGNTPNGEVYFGAAKNGSNILGSTESAYSFFALGGSLLPAQASDISESVQKAARRVVAVGGTPVTPPAPLVTPSAYFMSIDNISSTSNPWKGEEYNVDSLGNITFRGLESAVKIEDFRIDGDKYIERNTDAKGNYLSFDIPSMRDGWMFPLSFYYWLNNKIRVDSLWIYNWTTIDTGNYDSRWYKIYGIRDSSDFGNPIPLTDNIYTTTDDSFLKLKSKDDASEFSALILEYNKLDRNGLYGTIRMDAEMNFLVKLKDTVLGDVVNQYPDVPNNSKPFGEIAGINGFRTDQEDGLQDPGFSVTDSLFTTFTPYRYFLDMSDHTEEYDSGGFAFEPSLYFSGGIFDSDSTDENGLEIYTIGQVEAYTITANIKRAYDAGARDIICAFQKTDGSIHYLDTPTVGSPSDGYQNWNGNETHSDKFILIGDDPVIDWNSITRSKGLVDFNFGERYDWRKSWYDGFKNPDYHKPEWEEYRTATGRPTWLLGGSVVGDTMLGNRESKNWAKIGIAANQKIFNPDQRDSVYKNGNSWRYAGEFSYAFACYVGGGNCTWEDLKPFMVPLQDSTNLNLNLSVILSMGNEEDKYWDNGQAWISPMMGGMQDAVTYDGLCGTLQDRFGGYRIGCWTADTTIDGIRMSTTASYLGNGDYVRIRAMWMQYFRDIAYAQQQAAQGVERPRHPHNNAYIERKPKKLVFEIHDYPGKIDQSTKVKPQYYNDEDWMMAIPPEDLDHGNVMSDFARWAKYNYPNAEIALSEWAYGANDGATFSVDHEAIGGYQTGDSILVGGNWRPVYALPEGYQIRQICEILNWRMLMSPTFTKYCDLSYRYESRDYATASFSGNTDSTWAQQRGGSPYSKFSFMGFLIRNYRPHGGTSVRMNIGEVMNDYVFDEYVRQDSIWQVRYRHKDDSTQVYDVVYLPIIGTGFINQQINLLSGANNVQTVQVYTGTYTPQYTDIGNVESVTMDWTMKPMVIKYKID